MLTEVNPQRMLDGEPPLPITPVSPIPFHRFRKPGIQLGIAFAWMRDRLGFAG